MLLISKTLSNISHKGLKAFRLQYRQPGATDWTQLKEYVINKNDLTNNNEMLPEGGTVDFTKSLASFSDGNYLFRVVSVATYGNDEVYRYSEELPLIKDMMIPRPLGTPEPSDGVLDIGDDLSLTFNENIIKGVLTKDNNFTVSGVLNGARIAHETALSLNGTGNIAATDANIMLAGKDFSIDMWLYLGSSGTILKAPLFVQGDEYIFSLEGYELYENYDANPSKPVVSKVPLKDVVVTIENALSSDQIIWLESGQAVIDGKQVNAVAGEVAQLNNNQLRLDKDGRALYKWHAGLPNVSSPYTRTVSMSYDISGRTYKWDGKVAINILLQSSAHRTMM